MKLNERTKILGNKVVLVPYRKSHVLKYHKWMQNPELQKLTASEPLTLDEEYAMQSSWQEDEDKCTFIILDQVSYNSMKQSEISSMVGDVNLFFNDIDDRTLAEIEVMIAESESRGKGLGKEAVLAMMFYAVHYLDVSQFSVKIGYDNLTSLSLFHKLGFTEISRSDVFSEVTLILAVDDSTRHRLDKETQHLSVVQEDNCLDEAATS